MFGQNKMTQKSLSDLFLLIDQRKLALPELQRPSVWESSKIPRLLSSLYCGYPFGMLLIWTPRFEEISHTIKCRPFSFQESNNFDEDLKSAEHYLIDGQQRLTSFYKSLHPSSYDENLNSKYGINIAFNMRTEEFQLIDALLKQKIDKKDDGWFRLKYLINKISTYSGIESIYTDLNATPDEKELFFTRSKKLIEALSPDNIFLDVYNVSKYSYADVTEIFERINLGTPVKLSQILLGKLSAKQPGIVSQVENHIRILRNTSKYDRSFDLDTFMLMFTVLATEYPELDRLEDRFISQQKNNSETITYLINKTLSIFEAIANFCNRHYSIDRMRFFRSERTMISIGYAIHKYNISMNEKIDYQIAHWGYITALGNQHNDMNRFKKDISIIRSESTDTAYDSLMSNFNMRGHLQWILDYNGLKLKSKPKDNLNDDDVIHNQSSHLFGCIYGLIRKKTASSFKDGTQIDENANLDIHHIYPKSLVITMNGEISRWHSDIANLTFITKKDNLEISNSDISYLNGISESIKESHLIPKKTKRTAKDMTPDAYKAFITERRILMHTALLEMIENLKQKATLFTNH